jgi:putative nucleotidyltransferase with HDIG domain
MSEAIQDIRNRLLLARLPVMPQILVKLLEFFQADEAGMTELAKLIANDAGMTSKVLNVINSAAYSRGGKKMGLVQALSLLGLSMVKTMVMNESVFQTFNGFAHAASTDLRWFWKHSLTVAVIAREMAKKMNYPQVEEAYLAGLLHDVGRLALLAVAPNEYGPYFPVQDSDSLCDLEQQLLQISHAEAGAWLVERWQLDSFLADSILYHHEITDRLTSAHALIRIVHLAQGLADLDPALALTSDVGVICGLTAADLQSITQGTTAQVEKAAQYLGVDILNADIPVVGLPVAPMPSPGSRSSADPAQARLAEEVRNRALIAEFGQALAQQQGDAQLLSLVRQNAQILFNLDDTVILLLSGNGEALVGVSFGETRQRLAALSIALSGGGAIAASALQRTPVFLERQPDSRSIAEDQLLRIFNAECLFCLPLTSTTRCLGVMVAGIPSWRIPELRRQIRFLHSFAAQAAAALEAATFERGEIDRRIANLKEEQRVNAHRVAHEINNPLGIIKNYLGVLDDKITRQEAFGDELSVLNEEIDRIGSIMSEFVGALPKAQLGRTDINHVISDLVHLFKESRFMPSSVQISAQVSEQPCEIEGSVNLVKQILVNLIKNAVEALPEGGQIVVQNKGQVRRENRTFFELCVQDSGTGIAPEVMANLYAPGHSTKTGANRGLGLNIVDNLVKRLGGFINCSSSAAGTIFVILLPTARPLIQGASPVLAKDMA